MFKQFGLFALASVVLLVLPQTAQADRKIYHGSSCSGEYTDSDSDGVSDFVTNEDGAWNSAFGGSAATIQAMCPVVRDSSGSSVAWTNAEVWVEDGVSGIGVSCRGVAARLDVSSGFSFGAADNSVGSSGSIEELNLTAPVLSSTFSAITIDCDLAPADGVTSADINRIRGFVIDE